MFKKSTLLMLTFLAIVLAACGARQQSEATPLAQPDVAPANPVGEAPVNTRLPEPSREAATAATGDATTGVSTAVDAPGAAVLPDTTGTYPIVDTDQTSCFSDSGVISCGDSYQGQDAQYAGLQPAYRDNGDGTVTDLNTGLMWIQDPGEKTYYSDALARLENYTFAGYDDWRLPTIKELYALALFSGVDASAASSGSVNGLVPFMDTDYFVFRYGDESGGARVIDAQWLSSTVYNSTVMNGQSCFFGFNFSDGRIKCYPLQGPTQSGGYFAMFVRGGDGYGVNDFVDNGNGTISDRATGLTWTQSDNGEGVLWDGALNYCESLSLGGADAWRLPNIKELQSLVDYGRSPDATNSPAIDPLFNLTSITNEAGQPDYPFYWSSTTLVSYPDRVADATYISFGRAMGYMEEFGGWIDVHGAGAQRSDAKAGVSADHQLGAGPQGDARRSDNYVLCVTGGEAQPAVGSSAASGAQPETAVGNEAGAPGTSSGQPQGGAQPQVDLAAAAVQLGVTEQALQAALGEPAQGPPDFAAAADQLGVTQAALMDALGVPAGGPSQGGNLQSPAP